MTRLLAPLAFALVAALAAPAAAETEPADADAAWAQIAASEGVVLVDLWAEW